MVPQRVGKPQIQAAQDRLLKDCLFITLNFDIVDSTPNNCRFVRLCVLRVWVCVQVRVARVACPMGSMGPHGAPRGPMGPHGPHGPYGPHGPHGSVRSCVLRALHVWVCAQVRVARLGLCAGAKPCS